MASIYVSTNASTGSGSLAEALSSASDGDVISFSENVFERGALIEIALAQTLEVDKNLTFDGGPFRVRLTPISTFRVAEIATGKNVVFTAFDFVGGVATGNGGGILCKGTLTLNRCKIAGCNASENGGGLSVESSGTANINDTLICGNKATSGNGGGFFIGTTQAATLNGVTIAANTGGNVAGNATSKNSLIADDLTIYGFVSPPASVPTSETWTWTVWQNWDFHLLDDASETPSTFRDAGTVADKTIYDLDGNFRGRTVDGVSKCSPGAYETIQADLFWIGRDSTGAVVASPSWTSADGWATSRFATSSGTRVPTGSERYFFGVDASFAICGALTSDATIVSSGGVVVACAQVFATISIFYNAYKLGVGSTFSGTSRFWSIPKSLILGDYSYFNVVLSYHETRETQSIDAAKTSTVSRFYCNSKNVSSVDCFCERFYLYGGYPAPSEASTIRCGGGSATATSGPIRFAEGSSLEIVDGTFSLNGTYDFENKLSIKISGTSTLNDTSTTTAKNVEVELKPGSNATLTLLGQKVGGVGTSATLNGSATVDGDGLTLNRLTLNANAILTFDAGYLGASTSTFAAGSSLIGTGYYAFGTTTDNGATFATTLTQVDYGAGITSFNATATTPKRATLTWTQTDAAMAILLERQTTTGWASVDSDATGTTATVDLPASGVTTYRVWDGATFLSDAAWSYFGVQFSVDVAFIDSAIFSSGTNWITEAKLIPTGSALIGQSKTILARIYDSFSHDAPLLNNGLNIASTRYTIYKNTGDFFASGSTRTAVPGQTDVDAGSECVLGTMQTSDAWTDSPGYNFVLPLNNSATPCFAAAGSYLINVTITLTTGNPIVFGIEINVS